jgi:hypothetical protein
LALARQEHVDDVTSRWQRRTVDRVADIGWPITNRLLAAWPLRWP